MSEASLVAFNLLLNGVGSFAIGALVAALASRTFRRSPGRATVWLWSLPFVKVVIDAARGVPDHSFLWLRAQGATQDLGALRLGVGLSHFVPRIQLALGAVWRGETYPQSAADLVAAALSKRLGASAPAAVVVLLSIGMAARVARRARALLRADRERRHILRSAPQETRRVRWWSVPIHVVSGIGGSPYTAGLFRPLVVFPEASWVALDDAEREAAIQHELAHVRELHPFWMLASGLVSDLFWFVPLIDRARSRLASACEIAADAVAVGRGADPVALASALVRTREVVRGDACSLGAARSSLGARVGRLLDGGAAAAPSRVRGATRAAFVLWAAAIVALSVPFGNH